MSVKCMWSHVRASLKQVQDYVFAKTFSEIKEEEGSFSGTLLPSPPPDRNIC